MRNVEDVVAFLAVADCGGLSRAADGLGASKSVVSRRVSRLEAELGARLLVRTTRGVALTAPGEEFATRARRLVDELEALRHDMARRDGDVAGRLRVSAPMSFGIAHLATALAAFAVAHPRVELDVSYTDRFVDLAHDGVDVAVRIGALPDSGLMARKLATVRTVIVASPDYLARRGTPQKPADLSSHDCIVYSGALEADRWRFHIGGRWVPVRVSGRVRADNGEAVREAAIAGLGIAAMPSFLIGPAMERGDLALILPGHATPERALFVVRTPGGPASAKVQAMSDFLAARFGPEPYWDPCWRREQQARAPAFAD